MFVGDNGYNLRVYINNVEVKRVYFVDKIALKCAKFKHEMARDLGARFDKGGYWRFDTVPYKNRGRMRRIFRGMFEI